MNINPDVAYNNLPLLPPDFNFDDIEILKKLNSANTALAKLSGSAVTIPNREILFKPLTVREAVASSGIENINTTVQEVFQAELMRDKKISKEQKETLYYKDALIAGYKLVKERGFFNTNMILDIQAILVPDKKGIRKLPGTKIINQSTGQVLYTPPDGEDLIRSLLKNFEDFLNEEKDEPNHLIKMAILHYQFEAIHPFYDGNGRVGRILMVLYLVLTGKLGLPILFISGFINNNRNDYYRLLREVTHKNNWKEWVIYILNAVENQSLNTYQTVEKIRDMINETRILIKETLPKIYSADLVEFLFSYPFYSQSLLGSNLNISRNTSSKYLKLLIDINLLEVIRIGNDTVYFNNKFLKLLS